MKPLFFFLVAVLLAACATASRPPEVDGRAVAREDAYQIELEARLAKERMQRLEDVGGRLRRANVEICGAKTAPYLGMTVARSGDFPAERRVAAAKAFHLGPRLTLTLVAEGGPAAEAGLREGDEVVTLNGKPVPTGRRAERRFLKLLDDALERSPEVTFGILRDGTESDVRVKSVLACNMPIVVQSALDPNAFADGRGVVVTTGMFNFARSDEELALVLGHEMAHNSMLHLESDRTNAAVGSVLDSVLEAFGAEPDDTFANLGAGMFSHAQEFEADYVGTYIAARGGYEVDKATDFWRKMVAEFGASVRTDSSSHPNSPARYLKIEAAADEIWLKKRKGEPLLPVMQDGKPFRAPSLDDVADKDKHEKFSSGVILFRSE